MKHPYPVYTIGHSTRSFDEFCALLKACAIGSLVDIRRLPGSRKYPQFDQAALASHLPSQGVGYHYIAKLGGRRGRSLPKGDKHNGWWRNQSFQQYADYALGDDFAAGLAELETLAGQQTSAIMCAEAVWWRCHRRIVTDYLLAHGYDVQHILAKNQVKPASMTPGAVVESGRVWYPPDKDDDNKNST